MDEGAAAAAAASGAGAACADPGAPCWFDMGPGTLRVCRKELHGGARANVAARMRAAAAALGAAADTLGVALLKGGDALPVYATDGEVLFRQDAYFFYLFGVVEEGFWGAIDLRDGGSVLFMPRLPESYAVWMGPLHGPGAHVRRGRAGRGGERAACWALRLRGLDALLQGRSVNERNPRRACASCRSARTVDATC